MKLPILPLTKPSSLSGLSNGKLPDGFLVATDIGVKLEPNAARAFNALNAAASANRFKLRATGGYRSYERQEALFLERYTTEKLEGRPIKNWNSKTYYQKPGTAMAATPGNSNHGLGLAVDLAEENDGDSGVESVSTALVTWLCANASRFGISAEDQSEVWHWRYVAGDNTPAAVLAYEASKVPGEALSGPVEAPKPARPALRRGSTGEAVKQLQRRLVAEGFPLRGGVDGIYGKYTEGAVKRYQVREGLLADGVVGLVTLGRLGL